MSYSNAAVWKKFPLKRSTLFLWEFSFLLLYIWDTIIFRKKETNQCSACKIKIVKEIERKVKCFLEMVSFSCLWYALVFLLIIHILCPWHWYLNLVSFYLRFVLLFYLILALVLYFYLIMYLSLVTFPQAHLWVYNLLMHFPGDTSIKD